MPIQSQTSIPAGPRAHRNHDYIDLFPKAVYPTGDIDVLEQNGRLLFIKSYEYKRKVTPKQHQIWSMLTKLGELEQAKGSITICCVWGLGHAPREWIVYDHMNPGGSTRKAGTVDDWRGWVSDWFKGRL